jgi:2-C-methyl-D-erythritol 2,4-cyclodiphosphate synthase
VYRIGIGKAGGEVVAGRDLLLGGVNIASEYGLIGVRDGDIISLAVCEALMGCANFGGIDDMFPPDAPEFKDALSFELLTDVFVRIANQGYRVGNIDILLSSPIELADYIPEIQSKISIILETNRINIKTAAGMQAECTCVCICDQNLLTKRNREVLAIRNPGAMNN